MFDFENPFKEEIIKTDNEDSVVEVAEEDAPAWETCDWEDITHDHAKNAPDAPAERCYTRFDMNRVYKKARTSRRERTGIRAARYAMVAVFLAALAYLIREIGWLAIAIGGISTCTGLISAYGIGRYHEM
jgi:hypothetical protein